MRLVWVARDDEAIPWWAGYVAPYELGTKVAIVPLNWILAVSSWFMSGLRYNFMPRSWRNQQHRRALENAFERGRRVGLRQGRVHGLLERHTLGRQR